jgi:hypothetical protein
MPHPEYHHYLDGLSVKEAYDFGRLVAYMKVVVSGELDVITVTECMRKAADRALHLIKRSGWEMYIEEKEPVGSSAYCTVYLGQNKSELDQEVWEES